MKAMAFYSTARDAWWRGGERRYPSERTENVKTAMRQQQAGWRNTYIEHATHVRHRARVPATNVLIEGNGILQYSRGRMVAWSERRYPSERTENVKTAMRQQQAGWRNTYIEHATHVRHRARVPSTNVLIEGKGILQYSRGRMVAWSERRYPSEGTGDDETATQRHQQARWRITYKEHESHVCHRARVPATNVLIEGNGILKYSRGRMVAWSERRYRSEGTGDDDDTATRQQQKARWRVTYTEHVCHGRQGARVPATNVLIEDTSSLQSSEGRMVSWSERRYPSEGTGDDETATQRHQQARWRSTYKEHETHARHARRARRDQIGTVSCHERQQTIAIALGVQDAVHLASVAHFSLRAEHGDAVVGEVEQLQSGS